MKNGVRGLSVALLLVVAASGSAQAQQGDWWGGVSYQGSLTAGETADFIDQFSFRNVAIEGRKMMSDDLSIGMYFAWNVFNEDVTETVSMGSYDVSGYQSRFINSFPMMASVHYYFGETLGRSPRFFIGTGVGTYFIENRLEIGTTAITLDNWHFGLAPEVGIALPSSRYTGAVLNVKYNYAFEVDGVEASYWTFGIGFVARS